MSAWQERLDALLAEATPGPWKIERDSDDLEYGPDFEWLWRIPRVCDFVEEETSEADAAFIAAARHLVPLLADVAKAAERIEWVWEQTGEAESEGVNRCPDCELVDSVGHSGSCGLGKTLDWLREWGEERA